MKKVRRCRLGFRIERGARSTFDKQAGAAIALPTGCAIGFDSTGE
jgi:hypothetical protein